MTTRRFSRRLAAPLLLASLLAPLLAACNSSDLLDKPTTWTDDLISTGRWKQMRKTPDNEVEIVTIEHEVAFTNGSTAIQPRSRNDLVEFLRSSRVGPTDRVSLYGPRRDIGRHDPVTAERLQVLSAELGAIGVRNSISEDGRLTGNDPDAISVLITRSVVISPDCAQAQPADGHRPRYNQGCSNTALLGQMIYDPLDLKQGRPSGPADGEAAALGIQRYREGKIIDLDTSQTSTTSN